MKFVLVLIVPAVWAGGAHGFAQAPAAKDAPASAKPAEPAHKEPTAPALSAAEKSVIMKFARATLEAHWSEGNPEDVPGAALRDRDHAVSVTIRRSGATLGRAQAQGANLLESMREALAAAVSEARGRVEGKAGKAVDLRLDVEIAGEATAIRWRHVRATSAAGGARFVFAKESFTELRKGGKTRAAVPEVVVKRVQPIADRPFADEKSLRAELVKLVPPEEYRLYGDMLVDAARTSAPVNISGDVFDQCRRGIHGLLVEHQGKRIAHGRTYAGETIADNLPPVGFMGNAMSRAYLPKAMLATDLKKLLDDGSVRMFRFRAAQLVETDGKGGWWEPVRGHAPVTAADVTPARVQEAIRALADHMARRQVLMNSLNYFPSVDEADKTEGPADRATVAWAMAEAAAAMPKNEVLHRFALASLGRITVSTRLIPVPSRRIDFLPIRPEERVPSKAGEREDSIRIRVVPEADGERANLGGSALAAIAMTRFPVGRPRTIRVVDPNFVGPAKEGKAPPTTEIDVVGPRDQLLLSVIWMQNRDAGPARPDGLRPREDPDAGSWTGSFRTWFPPVQQPLGQDLFGGQALLAIAVAHARIRDAALRDALLACLKDGLRHYSPRFKKQPALEAAGWQIPAFAAIYAETGDPAFGEYALHMADWLLLQQAGERTVQDADMIGGFLFEHDSAARPGVAGSLFVHALCAAHAAALKAGDGRRAERYRDAVRSGVRFLLQLQFAAADTYYCRRPDLARGGIRSEIADNSIHQSGCAHTLIALIRSQEVLWGEGR